MNCIKKLVDCMEGIDIEDMDCGTCFKMQEMLSGEIDYDIIKCPEVF